MLTEERYNKILEALKNKGTITVAEMTECTGASESTIRRDLIALDEMGKLNKVHGGATAVAHQFIADEIAVSVKEQLCVEEKKAIARYAVNMINDDDFIFIDAGTSTGWMIEYLESTRATFVTNGIANSVFLIFTGKIHPLISQSVMNNFSSFVHTNRGNGGNYDAINRTGNQRNQRFTDTGESMC